MGFVGQWLFSIKKNKVTDMIVIKHTQPQHSARTADLLAAKGQYVGNGVTVWSDFDEKEPVLDLPEPCKEALRATYKDKGCKYNPRTAAAVFELIEQGKELKEIIHALRKRPGCGEANVRWMHAAIKKGLRAQTTPLPKPNTKKTIIWV